MAVTKISSCRYEKSSFITLPLEELGFDPLQQGDCIRPFGASAIPFEEGFGYNTPDGKFCWAVPLWMIGITQFKFREYLHHELRFIFRLISFF